VFRLTAEWAPDSDRKKNNKLYNHHSLFFTVADSAVFIIVLLQFLLS